MSEDNFLTRMYEMEDEENEQDDIEEKEGKELGVKKKDGKDENDDAEKNEEEKGDIDEDEEEASSDDEDGSADDLPPIQLDLARGEGPVISSSSSEGEEDGSDENDDDEDSEGEGKDDGDEGRVAAPPEDSWSGMDTGGVRHVEWASSRLAICNLDWGKLTAEDLMLILQSFKPPVGSITSLSIYMSDFGVKRVEEERKNGPRLKLKPTKKGKGVTDDLDERTKQAIRAYELGRLRYYYAVCECDSVETATAIYEACDGVEFEATGMRFDLRFIPEDMKFEENRLRDRMTADQLDVDHYKAKKRHQSHPLIYTNPKLSWEATDPERRRKMKDAFEPQAKLDEFEGLIASASDEDEHEADKDAQKRRYELLMAAAREAEEAEGHPAMDHEEIEMEEQKTEAKIAKIQWEEPSLEMEEEAEMEDEVEEADGQDREIGPEEDDDEDSEDQGKGRGNKKKTKFQLYLERKKQLKSERKQREQNQRKDRKQQRKRGGDQEDSDNEEGDSPDKKASSTTELIEADERFSALFKDSAFAIDRTRYKEEGSGGAGGRDLAKVQAYAKLKRRRQRGQSKSNDEEEEQHQLQKLTRGRTNDKAFAAAVGSGMEEPTTDSLVQRLKKKQKLLEQSERRGQKKN